MNVVAVNLRPLPSKHYSTEIGLVVNLDGHNYNLYIEISGYAPVASTRDCPWVGPGRWHGPHRVGSTLPYR